MDNAGKCADQFQLCLYKQAATESSRFQGTGAHHVQARVSTWPRRGSQRLRITLGTQPPLENQPTSERGRKDRGVLKAILPNLFVLEIWYRWPYIPELHQQTSKLPASTAVEACHFVTDNFEETGEKHLKTKTGNTSQCEKRKKKQSPFKKRIRTRT